MPKQKMETITTIALFDDPQIIKKTVVRRRKPIKGQENIQKIEVFTLNKHEDNPILMPKGENWWESWQVFNPGVVSIDGNVHILYRSIGEDGISRFGYAFSADGLQVDNRLNYPIYQHALSTTDDVFYENPSGGSWGGCEDPRITQVDGEDTLYMTYTACDGGLRVALTSIKVEDFVNGKWNWKTPALISPPGEVHKNWVIFPEKINGKYAVLHSIKPDISIEYLDSLDFEEDQHIKSVFKDGKKRKGCWDSLIRGIGPTPIKTKYGWLLFYHAMDADNPSQYKVGAMLTDLNDPTKILFRSKAPVLEPTKEYENNGFKAGVVYASGAVVKDGKLFVYYGGSDSYICVAYCDLEEFLQDLMRNEKPKLKRNPVKKKS